MSEELKACKDCGKPLSFGTHPICATCFVDEMAQELKLLPCPFCGGDQVTTAPDREWGDLTWHVCCKACGADVQRDLEREAIAAWNRRVPAHREGGGA